MEKSIINKQSDDDLNDDNYEKILKTILDSKVIKEVDIKKSIFADDDKRVLSEIYSKVKLDCLKIEDTSYDDIFLVQDKFTRVINDLTTNKTNKQIIEQINNCNLNNSNRGNSPSIGELCSIENMVESTYGFHKDFKYNIAEEICYMKLLACKWRSIKGDGNCFYRSVIFGYLENLIIEKDILNLQRIAIDIYEKFDANYRNTKSLPFYIKDSIIQLDKKLIITILNIIIQSLDMIDNKNCIVKALIVLAKAFNFSKTFDSGMIIYFRYILYEYIIINKNKFFSEDFPVKIGNLLPYQYETDVGDFLFDKFFVDELLKFYTYAEKIVIYLTPFVLKVDLNIIFYDFGNDCNIQTKSFSSYLKDKPQITILYRKAHYDIAYTKTNPGVIFSYYLNEKEKLKVVDQKLIEYYEKNEMLKVNLKQSKIFNKKEKKEKIQESNRKSSNSSDSTAVENTTNNISVDSTKSKEKQTHLNCNADGSPAVLKCEEIQKESTQSKFKVETGEYTKYAININEDEIKSKLCINCLNEKDCKSINSYKLPCGCYLCTRECSEKFSEFLFKDYKISQKESKFILLIY